MKQVFKYPLGLRDFQDIELPGGAEILSVQVQGSQICLWALVDPDAPKVSRRIRIAGTGHAIEHWRQMLFLGTVQLAGGQLVFHVFDCGIGSWGRGAA